MAFSIQEIAEKYIAERFPRASEEERQKYIDDWTHKLQASAGLVKDFTERVGDPQQKKILDAGCGNGGVSVSFSRAGAEVWGVEIERALCDIAAEQARALGVSARFLYYDGTILPFADNFFDYAVSTSVLEHTSDPVLYLKEILRTVRLGGKLYLGFPNKLQPRETHTRLLFLTYVPAFLRPAYIRLLRRNPLEDNNLHFYGYFDFLRMLRRIRNEHPAGFYWKLLTEEGRDRRLWKRIIRKILATAGLSYKLFLPQILVVVVKERV